MTIDLILYGGYIIHLIKSAFSGEAPKEMPKDIEVDKLIELAVKHSVANIIYEPLSSLGVMDQDTDRKLGKIYKFAIMNDAVQSHYTELISNEFEKNEIPHCVMKGPVIKELYPRSYFRQSGDLDIFVPEEHRKKSRDIMTGLGFEIERFNDADADDVYFIGKKIHVELHKILVSNKTPWQAECQKITDRLILKNGRKYELEMTPEDYYLYMIAHMAKHMMYSGMGIKMVLDVWVYNGKYADTIDRKILNDRLELCGLSEFEQNVCKLVDYWFYNKSAEKTIQKLSYYVLVSGTFGTKQQLDAYFYSQYAGETNSHMVAKLVYYWDFFFRPYKWMCGRYQILEKIPVLLPFCWVHRALKTLLFEREKAHNIASKYDDADLGESRIIQNFKREIGL